VEWSTDRRNCRACRAGAIEARADADENERKRPAGSAIDFAVRAHVGCRNRRANFGFGLLDANAARPEMGGLSTTRKGTELMGREPGNKCRPMSIVDYAATFVPGGPRRPMCC